MEIFLLVLVFIFYLFYTTRYTVYYVKLDCHFTRKQKVLNGVLVWLLPFVWIRILKVVLKPKEYIFPKEYPPQGTTMSHGTIDGGEGFGH